MPRSGIGSIPALLRRLRTDDVARQSVVVLGLALPAGGLNYAYQLSMGALLAPGEYAALLSLFSLFTMVAVLATTIQISTTRFVTPFLIKGELSKVRGVWVFALQRASLVGLGLFGLAAVLARPVSSYLHIPTAWYVLIIGAAFLPDFALRANYGVLLGLQKFLAFGLGDTLAAMLRVTGALLFVLVGWEVYGALLAIPLGFLAVFLATSWFIRAHLPGRSQTFDLRGIYNYGSLAMVATLGVAALTNLDVVLAKHYLPPEEAGRYAAIAVLGRTILYLGSAIGLVLFPKAAAAFDAGRDPRSLLYRATAYVLVLALLTAGALWLSSGFLSETLFGGRYGQVREYLGYYCLGMILLSVAMLLTNYFLSLRRPLAACTVVLVVVAQIGLIAVFHASVGELVRTMVAVGGVALVVATGAYFWVSKSLATPMPFRERLTQEKV